MSEKSHERRCDSAKKAVDAVHQDTTVDVATTMMSLKDIREHVNILIESVASDLEMHEEDE
jgi:hypothetical protein